MTSASMIKTFMGIPWPGWLLVGAYLITAYSYLYRHGKRWGYLETRVRLGILALIFVAFGALVTLAYVGFLQWYGKP